MKTFAYPLTLPDAQQLCHPNPHHPFARPWAHDGAVWVANAFLCLRIDTHLDIEESNPIAAKRIADLPWHTANEWTQEPKNTGNLDDRRAALFMHGRKQLWKKSPSSTWKAEVTNLVAVGHYGIIIPVPVLQLIAMLPRPRVRTNGGGCNFLPFSFNGGVGLAAAIHADTPKYQIFKAPEKFKL